MLIECLSNKQIASRLRLSLHTVKNHVHHILEKLGLQDRLEVVKQAHQKEQDRRALPSHAVGVGGPA
jgi:DNA-binding NarL/FixJ family response regulator